MNTTIKPIDQPNPDDFLHYVRHYNLRGARQFFSL